MGALATAGMLMSGAAQVALVDRVGGLQAVQEPISLTLLGLGLTGLGIGKRRCTR